jgi:hypothetical protein
VKVVTILTFATAAACSAFLLPGQFANAASTPTDKCAAISLQDAKMAPPDQLRRAHIPTGLAAQTAWFRKYCGILAAKGALTKDGYVRESGMQAAALKICVTGMDSQLAQIPLGQRAFSVSDWHKFGTRFCTEAVKSGLWKNARTGANASKITALSKSILADMLRLGVIHALR